MESDLRTPAARLRAGLANLSAIPPDPGARPLPRASGRPAAPARCAPGRACRRRPARPAVAESEPAAAPRPERPRAGGGHRRRYVLRRKLEPLACWPAQYAKLPRRAWDDPRLHQGAKLTLAVILCAARGRRQFATYKRSLAAEARVCERTMYEHLKLLEATRLHPDLARLAPLAAAGAGRRPGAGPAPAAAGLGRGGLGAAAQPAPEGRRRAGRGRPAAAPDPPRARPRASRNRDSDSDDPEQIPNHRPPAAPARNRLPGGAQRWPDAPAGGSDASRRPTNGPCRPARNDTAEAAGLGRRGRSTEIGRDHVSHGVVLLRAARPARPRLPWTRARVSRRAGRALAETVPSWTTTATSTDTSSPYGQPGHGCVDRLVPGARVCSSPWPRRRRDHAR